MPKTTHSSAALVRVQRAGLRIGETHVPLRFFAYGQPGWSFTVFPEEFDRKTCVRIHDLDAIRDLYRRHAARRPPGSKRARRIARRRDTPEQAVAPAHHPPAPEVLPDASPGELEHEAARELQRANRLAVRLASLKARIAGLERPPDLPRMEELQRRHNVHLTRYFALRQRLQAET